MFLRLPFKELFPSDLMPCLENKTIPSHLTRDEPRSKRGRIVLCQVLRSGVVEAKDIEEWSYGEVFVGCTG